MKIGPLHLIRARTFRRLRKSERLWDHFSRQLTEARNEGNSLAARVLEHTHGLMHSPLSARFASVQPPCDSVSERSRHAAERVVRAYVAAQRDHAAPPSPSMWDMLSKQRQDFIAALEQQEITVVQKMLESLFATPLVHGLGQVHESHIDLLKQPVSFLHYLFTDTLVSLAEAVGCRRVTCMAQDSAAQLRPLEVDPDQLLIEIGQRLGFSPSYPPYCQAFGFKVGQSLCTIDSLTHAYAAWRLVQLGAGPHDSVYELGGGYGGLGLMAYRAGIRHYAIFDLPWVNALQGYFLIINLPENAVRLCGENEGTFRVEPYWRLEAEPASACRFLINSDSLPEMGEATALDYIRRIKSVTSDLFISINQEAQANYPGVGPQNCVRELVERVGGYRCVSRQRHWLRQGYVEELFQPIRTTAN